MNCPHCNATFDLAPGQSECPECHEPLDVAAAAETPASEAGDGEDPFKITPRPLAEPIDKPAPLRARDGKKPAAKPTVKRAKPTATAAPLASEPEPTFQSRFEELGFLFAKKRPPTIALIGMSNAGKSFFLTRLEDMALSRGWKLRQRTSSGSVDFAAGQPRPWEKTVFSTASTNVYSLGRSGLNHKDGLWIIDMKGELFRSALMAHFAKAKSDDIRNFWMILAAADAFILMTPATHALHLRSNEDETDELWDLANGLEPMGAAIHLLAREVRRQGGVQAAVESLSALNGAELGEELDQARERCAKPVLMLLTKTDVMLDEAGRRFSAEVARDPDCDPIRALAYADQRVFRQLLGWFDHFKVDFATASEGHDENSIVMDVNTPSYGIWEALQWTKRMAARARRPTRVFWRTRYPVALRKALDKTFRDAFEQ